MPQNILGGGASSSDMLPGFYRLPLSAAGIAGNGTETQTIITDGDSTFQLHYWQGQTDAANEQNATVGSGTAPLATTALTPNNFAVTIRLNQGRIISQDFIPQSILCPKLFPIHECVWIEFPGNSQITITVLNLTASTLKVDLFMRGYKLYGPLA